MGHRSQAREETYDEDAIGANFVCRWPDHRGARKRRSRPARREARQSGLPYLLRSQCAGRVRPRRRHAAFILVPDRSPEVRRDSTAGSHLRDGILGCGDGLPRNTLATTPTRADSQAAWDALEKARAIGAKTPRERDWIEALSAYFRDHDKTAVDVRLAAYNAAMERMAQNYPDDYEVQAYYALTLQASAPKSDLTYANQIKSAALLEKLFEQNPQHPGVTHYLIHAYDFAPLAEKGIASAR